MKKSISTLIRMRCTALLFMAVTVFPMSLIAQKTKSPSSPRGYANASYTVDKTSAFMKEWLLLGPVPITEGDAKALSSQEQEKLFDNDLFTAMAIQPGKTLEPVTAGKKQIQWQSYSSAGPIVDLNAIYDNADFVAAYALAEIRAVADQKLFLSLGSDDGVKVWLNGKLVHRKWIGRGATPDEDVVEVNLVKGSNQLLLKVQDMQQGWGFVVRFLDKGDQLIMASARGDFDLVEDLVKQGASTSKKNAEGLTAIAAAELHGRKEVVDLLVKNGVPKSPIPSPDLLVDNLYGDMKGKVVPAASVLVARDGKIIYKKAFGYQNIGQKTMATPETKFRIGSITKQFTASAILRLQEEGKLQITDKLSKYLPDFPRGDEVTIHHLLTHTSGIHSYTGKSDFMDKVTAPISTSDLISYFKNDPYDFNPGDEFRYNNSGYFLLGYIIEKVSGKSYPQYLKDNFFTPLQMTNTGVHEASLKLEHEATGYEKSGAGFKPSANWNMTWAGGAGALYSTVEDLYKWNEAVFNGKVLKPESMKAAFTPVKLNNGQAPSGTSYGYGWFLGDFRGEQIIQHGGGLHGFISQLSRYPKENLTVVILTNIAPPEVNMDANPIAEFYLYDKMDAQPSYSVKASPVVDVKNYEGRYDFGNGAVMTFTSENNNLFAQLTGQPKFPVFGAAPDEFIWKVVEARIKFTRDENGNVTGGDFTQGSYKNKITRLKEEVIVKLDPAIYQKYAGKYDYGDNIVITISNSDGKIYAQATNQSALELLPLSEKEFTVRDMNAKVTFSVGDDGKVNKLILDMAGQRKDVKRIE
jgi:CubicO group peptidase (beta-lactamase class C family)